jgi:deoxyribodipyrimidine photo-lyase
MSTPDVRIRPCNDAPLRAEGEWVLYWMVAHRRTRWNFGLDRAIEHARRLGKGLVVLEALRCDYDWASDRLHRFVIEGMRDNRARFAASPVAYLPYVEPRKGAGKGLLEALAARACVVVTDDFPAFFVPRMVAAAARRSHVRFEAVDSNGLYPMHATARVFTTAFSFRAHLQKTLPPHLSVAPAADPLDGLEIKRVVVPGEITSRWPSTLEVDLSTLPIDHAVGPAAMRGGETEGRRLLADFVARRLAKYADERNEPESDAPSGLSPYLHFGHVSVHEVFDAVKRRERWEPSRLSSATGGSREGFWGTSREAESFLDELITWREIGYNLCSHQDDYDRYESLPDWARRTLEEHAGDPRPHVYTREELEQARTHDPLWNAAQRQLVREGRMHNYLRMLWGKKVLEWSRTPREAIETLVHLNNKYAVDGRNPNSYSGIFWVFGRYDRAWGPERPIFGNVRYMSSDNTAKKLDVKAYLKRYSEAPQRALF